jgi:hypothetical protein
MPIPPVTEITKELDAALNAKTPDAKTIIDVLGCLPRTPIQNGQSTSTGVMADLFAMDARVFEGQLLSEHTIRVIDQYLKYFSEVSPGAGLSRADVLLMKALHDSGKGLPNDKSKQHESTLEVMDWLKNNDFLPLGDANYQTIRELINGDAIGKFVRSCNVTTPAVELKKELFALQRAGTPITLDLVTERIVRATTYTLINEDHPSFVETERTIREKAARVGVDPGAFLAVHIRLFQSDTTAYTTDSRNRRGQPGAASLEGLYHINPAASENPASPLFVLDQQIGRAHV